MNDKKYGPAIVGWSMAGFFFGLLGMWFASETGYSLWLGWIAGFLSPFLITAGFVVLIVIVALPNIIYDLIIDMMD